MVLGILAVSYKMSARNLTLTVDVKPRWASFETVGEKKTKIKKKKRSLQMVMRNRLCARWPRFARSFPYGTVQQFPGISFRKFIGNIIIRIYRVSRVSIINLTESHTLLKHIIGEHGKYRKYVTYESYNYIELCT